jgi:hypothetical protein
MFPIFKIIFNTGSGKLVSIQISTIATIMKEEFLDASRETDFSPFSSLKRDNTSKTVGKFRHYGGDGGRATGGVGIRDLQP